MRVLVAGANGRTGKRIVRLLRQGGQEPVAMIRSAGQASEFDALGVEAVVADLECPVDDAVRGCQAVIFAAGSGSKTGPDKTVLVDQLGAIRLMVAAQVAGANRFVMLSAVGADICSQHSKIAHYHKAKGQADQHLQATNLNYTIVRPGGLTDDPGRGRISFSPCFGHSGKISRDDVAQVIVDSLGVDNTIGKSFEILGGDVPICEVLAQV